MWKDNDETIVTNELRRLNMLRNDLSCPLPYKFASGVKEISRVYFIDVETPRGRLNKLVVKLDEMGRYKREISKIVEFKRELQGTSQIIWPVTTDSSDPVLIYDAANSLFETGSIETLESALKNNDPTTTLKIWPLIFKEVSNSIHHPTRVEPKRGSISLRKWEDGLPWMANKNEDEKKDAGEAIKRVLITSAELKADPAFCGEDGPRKFFQYFSDYLKNEINDNCVCSAIHGDLNPTNIILGRRLNGEWEKVIFIDLAFAQMKCPTAIDLARLELGFYQEILINVFVDKLLKTNESIVLQQYFRDIRRYVDGYLDEPSRAPKAIPDDNQLAVDILLDQLCIIRQQAGAALGEGKEAKDKDYILLDYNYALFFLSVWSLKHEADIDNPTDKDILRKEITVISALSAYNFIKDCLNQKFKKDTMEFWRIKVLLNANGRPDNKDLLLHAHTLQKTFTMIPLQSEKAFRQCLQVLIEALTSKPDRWRPRPLIESLDSYVTDTLNQPTNHEHYEVTYYFPPGKVDPGVPISFKKKTEYRLVNCTDSELKRFPKIVHELYESKRFRKITLTIFDAKRNPIFGPLIGKLNLNRDTGFLEFPLPHQITKLSLPPTLTMNFDERTKNAPIVIFEEEIKMRSIGRDKIVAHRPITSLTINIEEGCNDFDFSVGDIPNIKPKSPGKSWESTGAIVPCQVVAVRWKPKA